ncbi:DNAL4 [Acanthosepion pharaonis]|uniref:DNAL4 n=1 Tax=Acanthosepion pharaonis TaxID=158019 RepID=A0A812CGD2_ACAPH|nr:DNAL4 [Sepia pharaonis]
MGETKNEQEEVTVTAAAEKTSAVPNISMSYALPLHSDMLAEMKTEVLETCIVACEKFPENLDEAAWLIKSEMENKFCGHWHVVVGTRLSAAAAAAVALVFGVVVSLIVLFHPDVQQFILQPSLHRAVISLSSQSAQLPTDFYSLYLSGYPRTFPSNIQFFLIVALLRFFFLPFYLFVSFFLSLSPSIQISANASVYLSFYPSFFVIKSLSSYFPIYLSF